MADHARKKAKTNDNLDQLRAWIYGYDASTEANTRGARVYGPVNRGSVSYEQAPTDAAAMPERRRLDEVRPATAAGPYHDLGLIGARIDARHHASGAVTVDNQHGQENDTSGLAGLDY